MCKQFSNVNMPDFIKIGQIIGNIAIFQFSIWWLSTILVSLYTVGDKNYLLVFCCYVKFCWNQHSYFGNINLTHLAWKRLFIHAPNGDFGRIWPPKWAAVSVPPSRGIFLHGIMLYDIQTVKTWLFVIPRVSKKVILRNQNINMSWICPDHYYGTS